MMVVTKLKIVVVVVLTLMLVVVVLAVVLLMVMGEFWCCDGGNEIQECGGGSFGISVYGGDGGSDG